jgi:dTDP-4-amino-4,6-dideoxygalactose transaminase
MLAAQRLVRPLADHPALYYSLVGAYRFVTRKWELSVGSNGDRELETVEMPPAYARRMGRWQWQGWQRGLAHIDQKIKRCQAAAAFYDEFLHRTCLDPPRRPYYAEHGMLRYTIRVSERDELLKKARCLRIPVGDWFGSPLYPLERHLGRWGYTPGQCPVAERACQEVINLPTAQPLTAAQLTKLFEP